MAGPGNGYSAGGSGAPLALDIPRYSIVKALGHGAFGRQREWLVSEHCWGRGEEVLRNKA